jgi:hypothetical protein
MRHGILTSFLRAEAVAAVREHGAVAAGLNNRLWLVRGRGSCPSGVSLCPHFLAGGGWRAAEAVVAVVQGHGAEGAAEYIPFSHSHAVVAAYLGCSRSFLQLLGFQVR